MSQGYLMTAGVVQDPEPGIPDAVSLFPLASCGTDGLIVG